MITRIFSVLVEPALQNAFEEKFQTISVPFVKKHQGLISVSIGKPLQNSNEYVMISVWENHAALKQFAGENWEQSVIPKGMEQFVSECWVHHYENIDN